jgi:hypothetical protein
MSNCGRNNSWSRPPVRIGPEPRSTTISHTRPSAYIWVRSKAQPMSDDREDVFSNAVRAGKRTYFFDVRKTRGNDLFLTITESKKHTQEDGAVSYSKHKIYLYKEDFDKFVDGLHDTLEELERLRAAMPHSAPASDAAPDAGHPEEQQPGDDLRFEDLGKE